MMPDLPMSWTFVVGFFIVLIVAAGMGELKSMVRVVLLGSRNEDRKKFVPSRDIGSLSGKVVLITGAAGDLGRQTAIELAKYGRPSRIYVADLPRDKASQKAVIDRITEEAYDDSSISEKRNTNDPKTDVRYLELDLTSFESIRACAAEFKAKEDRLDILLLNAGIIRVASGTTKEGYEVHFGLNYLGHALLSKLLLPTLLSTAQNNLKSDVRILAVSSEGHAVAPNDGIMFDKLKTNCADMPYDKRYGQSKIALIGFVRELAKRQPELKTASIHPGRILTGMADGLKKESLLVRVTMPVAPLFCVPVAVGITNHLWAATSRELMSGKYYEPVGVHGKESAVAKDETLSAKLWEWTENELRDVASL